MKQKKSSTPSLTPLRKILVDISEKSQRQTAFNQGFRREEDENRVDLCLHSIVFSFESSRI